MTTLSLLLAEARKHFHTEVGYVHPTLYIFCASQLFESLEPDQRLELFSKETGVAVAEVQAAVNSASASLALVTEEERKTEYDFVSTSAALTHWLPLLDRDTLGGVRENRHDTPVRAIHFFGFKGGQARSTSLGMLSKALADDGFKVLVVDADVEAPSLDVLFDVKVDTPDGTLMGLCGWSAEPRPALAYIAQKGGGKVDLLACRPANEAYDMDFAAFALRTALDTSLLCQAVRNLQEWIEPNTAARKYDFVLFDHRTGLSTSIIPIINGWPGSVVVAVRLDGLSDQVTPLYRVLFANYAKNPGAFVSFSLDPEDNRTSIMSRKGSTIERLLSTLAEAIEKGADDTSDPISPDVIQSCWISWFHDRALLNAPLPVVQRLSKDNQSSIKQLRDALGIPAFAHRRSSVSSRPPSSTRSPSGATDSGWFIATRDIARLFEPNTNFSYVFGRKGTGKTRLFSELTKRGLAEPLMSAADYSAGGLQSGSVLLKKTLAHFENDFESFWWAVLASALSIESTVKRVGFEMSLERWAAGEGELAKKGHALDQVASIASALPHRRTFAIDGVETAVKASQLKPFVEALFHFLLTLQVDPRLSSRIAVRLFLRTDLSRAATQNIEQQTSGRTLELRWDVDAIFNFVLARIAATPWFNEHFELECELIREHAEEISEGSLDWDTYTDLLLKIFPDRLRRNNLQTMTFFTGYFSDAVGDDQARAAFYPRLFDYFLEAIANPIGPLGAFSGAQIEDGRISQLLVLRAHEIASQQFISEIKQELFVLLEMSDDEAQNKELVERFVGSFDGLRTPFKVDDQVAALSARMKGVDSSVIREAMNRLKEIGIFEERAGYPGEWRAGRLYKSALRMKYYRV